MKKIPIWMVTAALLAAYILIQHAPDTVAAGVSPSPLVVIDPGHGGWDPGAVRGTFYEKDLTLAVSLRLGALLQQEGIRVYYTRVRDTALASTVMQDLVQRADVANRVNATLLISIHVNIESTGTTAGPIVYYHASSSPSYLLASRVSQSLAPLAGRYRSPRPIRQWILAASKMPAINVEIGFLSHTNDAVRMQTAAYQIQLSSHIAQGLIRYLSH